MDKKRFLEAASLLLPNRDEGDAQILLVAEYAEEQFRNYNPQIPVVLLAKEDADTKSFRDFFAFCKNNAIDTGNREVIIVGKKLFFTDNFRVAPQEVTV